MWYVIGERIEKKISCDFLARGVGLSCVDSIDCGDFGDCLNRACVCKAGRIEKETHDFLGRKIKICVNGKIPILFMSYEIFFFQVLIKFDSIRLYSSSS
jgi:hypothetical protein